MRIFTILSFFVAISQAQAMTKVAVIDTGIDPHDERFTGLICPGHVPWNFVYDAPLERDTNDHGTHVAGLIKEHAGNTSFCFLFYKYYSEVASGRENLHNLLKSMKTAVRDGANIVNISGGGDEFNEDEYLAIKSAPQVTFVVAAGNEKQDLDVPTQEYYPASYHLPNEVIVGALDAKGEEMYHSSNWGRHVQYWEIGENVRSTIPCRVTITGLACFAYMSGTSMATAVASGKLIAGTLKKHPAPKAPQCTSHSCGLKHVFVRHR